MTKGVVIARDGSTYRVHTAAGELAAVLRGKLKREDDDRVTVGDVVELDVDADGSAAIAAIQPRRSSSTRSSCSARRARCW